MTAEDGVADSLLDVRELHLKDHVGFDSLPHQMIKKRMQEGFVFNLLLIGETGIGKSTLISSLLNVPVELPDQSHSHPAVKLHFKIHNLEEKGVNVKLTVIETAGYGDQINRGENIDPIICYIDSQFENWWNEELNFKRDLSVHRDSRIHACLYLVCPTGGSLKSLDVSCLRRLQDRVNIIPVIAKVDSLTKDELLRFKSVVRKDLEKEKIKVYDFSAEDEDTVGDCTYSTMMPFAVSASEDFIQKEGKMVRGRKFPWGTLLVEEKEHSEFSSLKEMLFGVNMEDMRDRTHEEHYEHYRRNRMEQLGFSVSCGIVDMGEKRKDLRRSMQEDEEQLRQKFVNKVKETEMKLAESKMRMEFEKNEEYKRLFTEMEKILDEKEELESKIHELQEMKNVNMKRIK